MEEWKDNDTIFIDKENKEKVRPNVKLMCGKSARKND